MQKRIWTCQEKLRVVIEGLSGQIEITKLCSKYQIVQTQRYRQRDWTLQLKPSLHIAIISWRGTSGGINIYQSAE